MASPHRALDGSAGRSRKIDVLLVCCSGGHLTQLVALREAWAPFSRVWVTFDKSDARSLLRGEHVEHGYGPTNRNMGLTAVMNLLRNLVLAWRLVGRHRPAVILSTGAGLAVPFAWLGRLRGSRVVYVESLTRFDRPSLTCRIIRPVSNRIYVQWPELTAALPGSRYAGTVFGEP
jgi:beta-1,4-N-acetylglucosaminyltransferase